MPRARKNAKRDIDSYAHADKERVNNPPVGLVTPDTDKDAGGKTYAYDPHLDPQLHWAGKAEHTSFAVPTVSLHVHERIDPRSIIEAVRKQNSAAPQLSLFATPRENPPIRQAIEFYRHTHNWTNRLIAGDSLLVMNSLLEKEGLAGRVQMVYIDPPYGIRYGSNFQPFVNKRDVADGRDEDLTQEPETVRAFRDTWELGIHSYLAYLRDRLLLARELLHESGSCFVQIGDENLHHVRELMDEVCGVDNFVSIISVRKTTGQGTASLLGATTDFIVWYARARASIRYHQIFVPRSTVADERYDQALLPDGSVISSATLTESQENCARLFRLDNLTSSRPAGEGDVRRFEFHGDTYTPGKGTFKTHRDGLTRLAHAERLQVTTGSTLSYRRFKDDFPVAAIGNLWHDISGAVQSRSDPKVYVVQSSTEIVARCILMTTDPGDLVFDPTCGSGTTAFVAEQWGRRWITCDTSRVALTLAKQRLMTANFDYYTLAHPNEGVGSGFQYKTVPHITLGSIANNPDIKEGMTHEQIDAAIARHARQETLYDQPLRDTKQVRVTGPFTVEAVPAPVVKAVDELVADPHSGPLPKRADESVARSGETLRQGEWRDELLKTGIRGKAGQRISFVRLEPLSGTRWLHAEGETGQFLVASRQFLEGKETDNSKLKTDNSKLKTNNSKLKTNNSKLKTDNSPSRVVVSFGPDHAPLEQRQVEHAWEEARTLRPQPKLLVFAAFQFDPEAAKDIDELKPELTGMQFLKVQMNADLLTDDLKKKRASNESFWLIGQPDVEVTSFQFLVFGEDECRIAEYGTFTKLSGLDRVEAINRLGWQDLFLYALLSQGRDVWHYLAAAAGWSFHPGQHRGRTSPKLEGGVPAVSWHSPRLTGGIGDLADDLGEFGVSDLAGCRTLVERLCRDRKIVGRLEEIAASLNFPITPHTKNWQLKTQNWHSVAVLGFDYYNTKTGGIESGGADKIAMWLLDPDYDGRSLFPRQVFFLMADAKAGWARLARNLKAEIDEDLIEAYRGTVSLPFTPGEHRRIAVKIIDDRGIESLKIVETA